MESVRPFADGIRAVPIVIEILFWDSRMIRYETKYSLVALGREGPFITGTDEVAPGVRLSHRRTKSRGTWLVRIEVRLNANWVRSKRLWKGLWKERKAL
jgi:hypothetical protein